MRILLSIIFLSQLSFAAELSFLLSTHEEQKLAAIYPKLSKQEVFSTLFENLNLPVDVKYLADKNSITFTGEETYLKAAEYIYISWVRDLSEVTFKFTHFEGSPEKRLIKHSFTKKLLSNQENSFQYSNKLLKDTGNNINGFTFNVEPYQDLFQKPLELSIRLSYKNEERKVGVQGENFLDMKTTMILNSKEEKILKLTSKDELGWGQGSYVSIEVEYDFGSEYFEACLPNSLSVKNDMVLRTKAVPTGAIDYFKNPAKTLNSLGVSFPTGSYVHLNEKLQSLIILNTDENMELFDNVGRRNEYVFRKNTECLVTIFESNLIIEDTDRLNGHKLKKVSEFSSICSKSHNFLLSKKFVGEYESSVYINFQTPYPDNKFKYDLIIKTPGPKSKAKNYKLEGNFAGNKKYKIHLDDYRFMEVEIQK